MQSIVRDLDDQGASITRSPTREIQRPAMWLDFIKNSQMPSEMISFTKSSWLHALVKSFLSRRWINSVFDAQSLRQINSHSIGYVYDDRMCLHTGSSQHVEKPARIQQIYHLLIEQGLLKRCVSVSAREVTQEELGLVHSPEYSALISKMGEMSRMQLARIARRFNSIYISTHTSLSASLSAGSTLALVQAVATRKIKHGVAIVRPPGHHAEADSAMGFCFFNNVALAAALAVNKLGMKRVMILDWDVHHGNGTQRTFFNNGKVLYVSLHRYENARFYPHSSDASPEMVGADDGEGRTINIAWDTFVMGDADYLTAFYRIILPCAREFAPGLVLISAGFDAAKSDPVGMCNMTPNGYSILTQLILNHLLHCNVIVALEGGYNLKVISQCMASVVRVLLGERQECPTLDMLRPTSIAKRAIKKTIKAHKKYWECFSKLEHEEGKIKNNEKLISRYHM